MIRHYHSMAFGRSSCHEFFIAAESLMLEVGLSKLSGVDVCAQH